MLLIFCSANAFSQNDTISVPRKIKEKPTSEYLSIISLIASPEKYYGKRVSVTGYMITEFEGTAIYLSREDFDNRIYKNSIFLLIGKGSDYQYYNKEYVTLDGTFIQGNGHMGLFSGMLKDVGYIIRKH
ncbi:hypothetical protein [Flavobacterium sp. UBA7663]|uniref:hypothetical protein n=1 Tax=Flavobacterium sp. UBA7663 TaxID=1946557 RepID=UPI0025C6FDE7|nr:hypothetical protein [Flavobacterium sp. UBA7663]